MIYQTAEAADEIGDSAQAVGVTAKALQELRSAASRTGVEATDLDGSLMHLSRTMNEAKGGGEGAVKALRALGTKATDAHGKLRPTDDVLMDIADHIAKMPDGAQKTAVAMDVFGRSGARLIPMLGAGREELSAFRASAVVMGDDVLEAGDKLSKTLHRLGGVTKGMLREAIAPLLPAVNDAAQAFSKWVSANRVEIMKRLKGTIAGIVEVVKVAAKIIPPVLKVLDVGLRVLVGAIKLVADNWDAALIMMTAAFAPFIVSAIAGAVSVGAAWLAAAAPFVLLAGLMGTVLLVINSLRRAAQGKDSLIGDWLKEIDKWLTQRRGDPWWLVAIKDLVQWMERALGVADKLGLSAAKVTGREQVKQERAGDTAKGAIAGAVGGFLVGGPLGALGGALLGGTLGNLENRRQELAAQYVPTYTAPVGTGSVLAPAAGPLSLSFNFNGTPEENRIMVNRVLDERGVVDAGTLEAAHSSRAPVSR